MNISSLNLNSYLSAETSQTSSASLYSQLVNSTIQSADGTESTEAKLSDFAQLLSKLEKLETEDPEKFQELMTNIATKLKDAAAATDDESEAAMLNDLADKFQSVADGGDLSQLLPAAPPPPPGGQPMYASSTKDDSDSEALSGVNDENQPSQPDSEIQQLLSSIFDELKQATSAY